MHEYSVELRIIGKDLDPSTITKELGLRPSTIREAGEMFGAKRWKEAVWGFNGSNTDSPPVWKSLEDGLAFVMARLNLHRSRIEEYKTQFELIWLCGHFQNSFDGGPTLSASILQELGDFGVPLYIDNYFSTDETGP